MLSIEKYMKMKLWRIGGNGTHPPAPSLEGKRGGIANLTHLQSKLYSGVSSERVHATIKLICF